MLESVTAQSAIYKSDLRIKVDSIIKYEIGYVVDSTTDVIPKHKWDPEKYKSMYPSFSCLPPNPMTLILLDGEVVEVKSLNNYELENISIKKVYSMNDKVIKALYGTAGKNGLIVLETKQ